MCLHFPYVENQSDVKFVEDCEEKNELIRKMEELAIDILKAKENELY